MNNMRVIVNHGEVNRLAEMFSVSLPTVRSALRGKTSTKLSQNIRKTALDRGGVQIIEVPGLPYGIRQ